MVYGLTKGQASPTTPLGEKRTLQVRGVEITPLNMLAIAIIIGGFVGGMLGSRAQKLFSEKTLKIVLAVTLFFLFFRFFKIEIWI